MWVDIGFIWAFFLGLKVMSFFSHIVKRRMVGARKRIEPPSCVQIKKDKKIWRLLEKGGVNPYIERLHGRNEDVMA